MSEVCCRCNLPKEPPKHNQESASFRYICRLCLMRAEDTEPIFIHPGDSSLAEKIFACTGVQLAPAAKSTDNNPSNIQFICAGCLAATLMCVFLSLIALRWILKFFKFQTQAHGRMVVDELSKRMENNEKRKLLAMDH